MYYINSLFESYSWLGSIIGLLVLAFSIWMAVDCIRNRNDWYWLWIIFGLFGIGAVVYFFVNKWDSTSLEYILWKRHNERRYIQELKAKIHHLDKADHFAELGDAYRRQRNWDLAKEAYEAALERDAGLLDARAHLGVVLLAKGRAKEAWKCMEPMLKEKPDFESGELMWQAARCQVALGQPRRGRKLYEQLFSNHGYFEAHYEYAELLGNLGESEASTEALKQLVYDAQHAPRFLQRRHRRWVRKARMVLRTRRVRI